MNFRNSAFRHRPGRVCHKNIFVAFAEKPPPFFPAKIHPHEKAFFHAASLSWAKPFPERVFPWDAIFVGEFWEFAPNAPPLLCRRGEAVCSPA